MNKLNLSNAEINVLRRTHRRRKNKRDADWIKVIYSLAIDHSPGEVASILIIDEDSIRNYQQSCERGGIIELLKNNHKGSECRISEAEAAALIKEL